MTVRTRFAPSPTGFLHIGGVRTALFNYLFAKQQGGRYILRIDDTDQERNVESALAPILHGFRWLGIEWNEGPEVGGPHAPYFQSKRGARYQEAVDALLASGHAYRDYARPEELDVERKAAEAEKRQFQYSRRWMASSAEDRARFEGEGRKWVVRLKMPREGKLVLPDLVRGDVEFQWAQEADHVIQRGDGSFIYHLANVVDDRDFEISHVIRAEEHLSNTPRQLFMVQALGYPMPKYAHLPVVAEPGSKRKLSKRKLEQYLKNPDFKKVHDHGTQIAQAMRLTTAAETFNPVIVDFYEQVGYLPDAIVNYLLLLGWSLDDKTEFFTRDEMVKSFSLERVQGAPASFDPMKLQAFQMRYMQELPLAEKVARARPFVDKAGLTVDDAKLARVVEALGDRIKVFGDILIQGAFFFGEDVSYDEKAWQKRVMAPGAVDKLAEYRGWLAGREAFDAASLDRDTQAWLAERGWALGDIVHAVRVAATGAAGGPGLFECLALIGKATCIHRLDRALARARG
ncbi:MAG: Glutamyl-tRNA synthetase, Glutamyl-tRNA(Gln) synthetase [Myxococcales bacterium]|nr:Glutamyl-tRNA synthetase, Glutamyl-tRNA(Gln) synthetase [Myxococcales bacterium]